jgi:predicted kinase
MTFADNLMDRKVIDLKDYLEEVPELQALKDCQQDPDWHGEGSVLNHTNMVMDAVRNVERNAQEIYISALLHDFGKPELTSVNEKGRVVSPGHEQLSVARGRQFLRKYFPKMSYRMRQDILSLVEFHAYPKRMAIQESTPERYYRLSWDVDTHDLSVLSHADFKGRIGKDLEASQQILNSFDEKCKELEIFGVRKYLLLPLDTPTVLFNTAMWNVLFHHWPIASDWEKDERYMKLKNKILPLLDSDKHEFVLMVGPAGSGKTAYAVSHYPNHRWICMDEERVKLCGDMGDMSKNEQVFNNCFKVLRNSLTNGENCVWDATNVTRKSRRALLEMARSHGAKITIVFFDLPLETILQRNRDRSRHVPEDVIVKMFNNLQSPSMYEYDTLFVEES